MTRFRRTETNARDLARWKRERPLDTKRGVTQGETDRRATAVRPRTGNRQGSNPVQSQRSREILAPCVLFLQRSKSLTSRWVRVLFPWGERLKGLRTVVDRSDRVRLLSLDLLCPCFSFIFFAVLLHPADTDRPLWGYPRGAPTAQRAQAARGRDLAVGSVVEKEGPSRLVDNLEAFQQLPGPTHQTQSRKGQAGAIKDDRSGRALVGLGKPIDYG